MNDKTRDNKVTLVLATRIAQWWNPIDRFLSSVLRSKYIHSELIMPDKGCFSSRGRTKDTNPRVPKGVYLANVNFKKGKWIKTEFQVSKKQLDVILLRMICILNKKYDIAGAVFTCGLNIPIDKKSKFWCSEAVAYVLQECITTINSDNVKPVRLLRYINEYNENNFKSED